MVDVSSERSLGVKQSRVRSGQVTEAVEMLTAIGGWSQLISFLIWITLPLKKLIKSSLLKAAGMHGSSEF